MLNFLNLLQLVLYVALLALAGQGVLYVLAGRRRDANFFYQLLRCVARPFPALLRRVTPARLPDRHVTVLCFALLALAYAVVTLEKISLCLRIGLQACR